jgi:hypothetical protein
MNLNSGIKNESQAIICLHDIARYVEHHFGKGKLAEDIRAVADRLNDVVKTEALMKQKRTPKKHDPDSIYMNTVSGQTHEG